jgi:hypothetical protein
MSKSVIVNGRKYSWNFSKNKIYEDDSRPRSQYHTKTRQLIKDVYGQIPIIEEVRIPGTILYLDFYIPLLDTAIEVHGEQHYKFNTFFHKTKLDFYKSLKRDSKKIEFCESNNIKLVLLKYDEQEKWRDQIVRL